VSVPLRGAKRAPKTGGANPGQDGTLFSYELRREGRPLASLHGVVANGNVVVEAEIYPIGRPAGDPPLQRPFSFASAEAAQRFADESLMALEYLNCELVDP
jgi:hypothetical protein